MRTCCASHLSDLFFSKSEEFPEDDEAMVIDEVPNLSASDNLCEPNDMNSQLALKIKEVTLLYFISLIVFMF